jgi:hypothetical protein
MEPKRFTKSCRVNGLDCATGVCNSFGVRMFAGDVERMRAAPVRRGRWSAASALEPPHAVESAAGHVLMAWTGLRS